jgi:phosphoadenosine phosphosulfate reductase
MARVTIERPVETGNPLADAHDAIAWAATTHGLGLCVTASFSDATLAHLVSTIVPDAEITLLDTGYLFAETEWFADLVRDRFDLNLRIIRPTADLDRDVWQYDTAACCAARKVEPLNRALADRTAWMTGVRRSDSVSRRRTPLIHRDLMRNVVKVNPIAGWSDRDVAEYAERHGLPAHPLSDRGYPSIGCWPCTRPVAADADPRSGRWADTEKTECGLHVS